ncbi:toll/interleukin-1 receptor domain-containing protein [Geotalea toluenoxydans]
MNKKVFISHISKDTEFARRLASDLQKAGIDAFVYRDAIAPGESIVEKIGSAILDSDAFVLILSRQSSANPWVSTEIALARARREKGVKHKIIPIVLEKDIDIPFFLKDLLYLEMTDDGKYKQNLPLLIRSILQTDQSNIDMTQAHKARQEVTNAQEQILIWEKELYELKNNAKQMLMTQQARFAVVTSLIMVLVVALFLSFTKITFAVLITTASTFFAGLITSLIYSAKLRKRDIERIEMQMQSIESIIEKMKSGPGVSNE